MEKYATVNFILTYELSKHSPGLFKLSMEIIIFYENKGSVFQTRVLRRLIVVPRETL